MSSPYPSVVNDLLYSYRTFSENLAGAFNIDTVYPIRLPHDNSVEAWARVEQEQVRLLLQDVEDRRLCAVSLLQRLRLIQQSQDLQRGFSVDVFPSSRDMPVFNGIDLVDAQGRLWRNTSYTIGQKLLVIV